MNTFCVRLTIMLLMVMSNVSFAKHPDVRFPFAIGHIEAGSVADFSWLNDAPAGKHGDMHVDDQGDYCFADGQPVRFFGINVVANRLYEMSQQEARAEARRLASLGVNLVRIHHAGASWVKNTPLYDDADQSLLVFNRQALDKLDFFIAELKKNGIYLVTDMIDSCWNPPGMSNLDATNLKIGNMKLRLMFDPQVQDYARAWIREFFTRKNPYTNKSLLEDSQLCMIEIVNEIMLEYHNSRMVPRLQDADLQRINELFTEYCQPKGIVATSFDPTLKDEKSARFWLQLMQQGGQQWKKFLRELGYRGTIAFSNCAENFSQFATGMDFDFTSTHLYWGYAPWYDGTFHLDEQGRFSSLLKAPRDEGYYCKELFAGPLTTVMPGKAMMITEHRTCIGGGGYPYESQLKYWRYRAVGLPFMSTIQAFQGWDGYCVFAMHGPEQLNMGRQGKMDLIYDVNYDTTYLGTFPVSSYLLRSGAITPARKTVAVKLTDADVFTSPNTPSFNYDAYFNLPEKHRMVTVYPGQDVSGLPKDTQFMSLAEAQNMKLDGMPQTIEADTGEFFRNWQEGYFVVDSPLAQGIEGFFNKTRQFDLKQTQWRMDSDFAVAFLLPCDRKPITQSKRMLLYVAGDCNNTDDPTTELAHGRLPGKAPVLLDTVKGSVQLKKGVLITVWKLDENGARLSEPMVRDVAVFQFDTGRDQTIWYEVTSSEQAEKSVATATSGTRKP
jgi:hypothetical protein